MQEPSISKSSLLSVFQQLVEEDLELVCRQQRVVQRLGALTLGLVLAVGRHTLSRVLITLGLGHLEWSAAYRLFSRPRFDLDQLRRRVVHRGLGTLTSGQPLTVVLDATHLPRTSRHFAGVGWALVPRSPVFYRGIHLAQRFVGMSQLLPRSTAGESRAVPLWFEPAPSPKARAWPGYPPRTEWQAGLAALIWLREVLQQLGAQARRVLVIADGSYSIAAFWRGLPPRVTVLARCTNHRALSALPPAATDPPRGRRRKYGVRGPTPQATLHELHADPHRPTVVPIMVRRRTIPLEVVCTGPWLVEGAPAVPLFLIVVAGVTVRIQGRYVGRRLPTYLLVSARCDHDGRWVLPYPLADLLSAAWQRWEVEVMHRELKSGFGLGEQQAWSPVAAAMVTQWVVWTYAMLILTGFQAWGWSPPAATSAWYHGRRWTARDVITTIRSDLWLTQTTAFSAIFPVTPGTRQKNRPQSPDWANAIRGAPHL